MAAPCYGCAYRQAGCHSVCERYISWKKELEAEKAYSKQFAPIDAMNLTHEQEKKNRQKRYKGGNQYGICRMKWCWLCVWVAFWALGWG